METVDKEVLVVVLETDNKIVGKIMAGRGRRRRTVCSPGKYVGWTHWCIAVQGKCRVDAFVHYSPGKNVVWTHSCIAVQGKKLPCWTLSGTGRRHYFSPAKKSYLTVKGHSGGKTASREPFVPPKKSRRTKFHSNFNANIKPIHRVTDSELEQKANRLTPVRHTTLISSVYTKHSCPCSCCEGPTYRPPAAFFVEHISFLDLTHSLNIKCFPARG